MCIATAAKQRSVHVGLRQTAMEQQVHFASMAAWKKKPLIANKIKSHLSSCYYFRALCKFCKKYVWEKFNTSFVTWLVQAKDNRQRCHILLFPCLRVVADVVRQRAEADVCVAFLIRSDNINEIQEPLVMVKDQKWLRFTLASWQEKLC